MECFFINLEREQARRDFLSGNFKAHKRPGWFLNRIAAIDQDGLKDHASAGVLRDAEKGCFLSHRKAIAEAQEVTGHALILEDDAMFGPSSCGSIEGALATLPADGWDLLFTDVVIFHPPLMTGMLHMRRELAETGGQTLINLNDITFCGATAYVINAAFKARMLELVSVERLDEAYDMFVRALIQQGAIRAFVTFPFATSLSDLADASQIQERASAADLVWNAFRRFIWVDRQPGVTTAGLQQLGADFIDPETAEFCLIAGCALSTRLVLK